MQRFKTLFLSLALVCAASSGAFAWGPGDRHEGTHGFERGRGHESHGNGLGLGHHKGGEGQGGGGNSVPELDPSAAGGALILLIGGTLVLLERRRG